MKSFIVIGLICLALSSIVDAQVDSISLPSDTYIDNIVDSTSVAAAKSDVLRTKGPGIAAEPSDAYALAPNLQPALRSQLAQTLVPPESRKFWDKKKVSLSYGFSETNSKLTDGTETTSNSFRPELYLESSKTGFVLDTIFSYQNLSKTDNFSNLGDTNIYSILVQPSQDVLHLLGLTEPYKLVFGTGFGYSHFEGNSSGPAGNVGNSANGYSISPNLVFAYPLSTKVVVSVAPSYSMQWKYARVGGQDVDTNAGLFSLLTGVNYKTAVGWTGSFSVTWKHDVNQKGARGQTLVFRDWAEFGPSLRYDFSKQPVGLKIGYSYEAFRSDFDTHKVAAVAEIRF